MTLALPLLLNTCVVPRPSVSTQPQCTQWGLLSAPLHTLWARKHAFPETVEGCEWAEAEEPTGPSPPWSFPVMPAKNASQEQLQWETLPHQEEGPGLKTWHLEEILTNVPGKN